MNKLYILAALTIASQAFAAGNSKNSKQKSPMNQGDDGLPANQFQPGYNAPARIAIADSWDVSFDGSFIYWHASQQYMDLGRAIVITDDGITSTVATQSFKYKPGFQVGMSFNTGHDSWSFGAEYTWLYQTVSDSYSSSSIDSFWDIDDWFLGVDTVTDDSLSSSWKLHFNMIDVYGTRPFYQGKYVTVAPYAGLRGLWTTQKFNIASGEASSNLSSKNWMIGPNAGMQANWILGGGFRVETMGDLSLLYTRFTKISINDTLSLTSLPESSSLKNISTLTPASQLGIGIGWGSYFSEQGGHIDLSARYDFMYLWNQNALRNFVGSTFNESKPVGDLMMHGLTASVRFDF